MPWREAKEREKAEEEVSNDALNNPTYTRHVEHENSWKTTKFVTHCHEKRSFVDKKAFKTYKIVTGLTQHAHEKSP